MSNGGGEWEICPEVFTQKTNPNEPSSLEEEISLENMYLHISLSTKNMQSRNMSERDFKRQINSR
jgi:hypothetical protein